jgi:hypothetical protein
VDPAHSLSGAQQEQRFSIIGVASSAHSFYDVQVELDLEVVHFGADVDSCLGGPMVIGVMAKSVLDQVLGPKASSSGNSSRRKKDVQNNISSDSRGSRDQGAMPSNADAPATTAATPATAAPDLVDSLEEDAEWGGDPKVTRQPTCYGEWVVAQDWNSIVQALSAAAAAAAAAAASFCPVACFDLQRLLRPYTTVVAT